MIDRDPPSGPDDNALDTLLAQAHWPDLPPQAMARLESRARQLSAPPRRLEAGGRGRRVLLAAGLAAAVAAGAGIWLMLPGQDDPRPLAVEPRQPDEAIDPSPRVHPAVLTRELPGRAPTPAELTLALAMRQPDRPPTPEALERQARRQQAVERVLARSGLAAPPAETGAMSVSQLVSRLEAGDLTDAEQAAAARQISAQVLLGRLLEADAARPALLQVLVQSHDASAPAALLSLADQQPALVRQAVARAPESAPAVLGLVAHLADQRVERREAAARLLSASSDPAVFSAIGLRLSEPGTRREALIALLLSHDPAAHALVESAERHPQLGAIIRSLRAQGITDPSPPRPQAVVL